MTVPMKNLKPIIGVFVGLFLFVGIISPVYAEEESEDEQAEQLEPLMYFEIHPNILTFYQGTGKKIGYVVVQVNIAVRGQDNYDLVENHLPLIQDNLIDFFNRKDKSVIQPFSERENLRVQAKESVAAVLKEETGLDVVENLLFTNYVYQ
jgi:flagellar FliL protein